MNITPRFIRIRDCAIYLGMDRNRFNEEVRPYLTEIPIGTQGVAFDRAELDEFADKYKKEHGKPPKIKYKPDIKIVSCMSVEKDFEKALEMTKRKTLTKSK